MADVFEKLICPYCSSRFRLGDLPIVATSHSQDVHGGLNFSAEEGDEETRNRFYPPSGVKPLGWVGKWPVVAGAPLAGYRPPTGLRRYSQAPPQLVALDAAAPPEDRPARICMGCRHPLPRSLDARDWFSIAVVGINRASKTHFISTSLHEAYYGQGLEALGCAEFEPDGPSADTYYNEYYVPVYQARRVKAPTLSDIGTRTKRFEPLVFSATFERAERGSLFLFHDVAGDDLISYQNRPLVAPFVARADAVIFLLDPLWLPNLRSVLRTTIPAPGVEQMTVFSSVVEDIQASMARRRSSRPVPIIVTLTKSDLLRPLLGEQHLMFRSPPDSADAWFRELDQMDRVVRDLLDRCGANVLLSKAARLEAVSFCAISPIGSDPGDSGSHIQTLKPIRVLDPLVAALRRLPPLKL